MTAEVGELYQESKRKTGRAARGAKDTALAITPESILNLVNQLGLTDLLMARIRARIEQADVDELIDDAVGYLKRNPEVLVALMAVTTMAAGVVLFLKSRDHDDDYDFEYEPATPPPPPARATSQRGGSTAASRKRR